MNLNILLQQERKLNTITKYPSILTYHELGKKGTIVESLTKPIHNLNSEELLEATEKVDGTNTRIIICGKDYLIGTREEFIYAKGDRIKNDKENILLNCIPIAERIVSENDFYDDELFVIYGENYGRNIGRGYKNYATEEVAFRVFDMWSMKINDIKELLKLDLNKLSTWREHNGQPYFNIDKLKGYCGALKLEKTPVLFSIKQKDLPITIENMYNLLSDYKKTKVSLDKENGKSEGFVIRNNNRSYIKKIRFEEYEKTLKIK